MKKKPLEGKVFAVDFDGTCVTHEYPKIGADIGAVPVLRRIVDEGGKIILWTMRSGKELQDAVHWLTQRDIPLFGINQNPEQDWSQSPKAYAQMYIDDAALGCPLLRPNGERPFVDWIAVEMLIWGPDASGGVERAPKIAAHLLRLHATNPGEFLRQRAALQESHPQLAVAVAANMQHMVRDIQPPEPQRFV